MDCDDGSSSSVPNTSTNANTYSPEQLNTALQKSLKAVETMIEPGRRQDALRFLNTISKLCQQQYLEMVSLQRQYVRDLDIHGQKLIDLQMQLGSKAPVVGPQADIEIVKSNYEAYLKVLKDDCVEKEKLVEQLEAINSNNAKVIEGLKEEINVKTKELEENKEKCDDTIQTLRTEMDNKCELTRIKYENENRVNRQQLEELQALMNDVESKMDLRNQTIYDLRVKTTNLEQTNSSQREEMISILDAMEHISTENVELRKCIPSPKEQEPNSYKNYDSGNSSSRTSFNSFNPWQNGTMRVPFELKRQRNRKIDFPFPPRKTLKESFATADSLSQSSVSQEQEPSCSQANTNVSEVVLNKDDVLSEHEQSLNAKIDELSYSYTWTPHVKDFNGMSRTNVTVEITDGKGGKLTASGGYTLASLAKEDAFEIALGKLNEALASGNGLRDDNSTFVRHRGRGGLRGRGRGRSRKSFGNWDCLK